MGALQEVKPWIQSKLGKNFHENIELKENELKIDLYPKKSPRYTFDKSSIKTNCKRCYRSFTKSRSIFSLYGFKCSCIKWILYSSY